MAVRGHAVSCVRAPTQQQQRPTPATSVLAMPAAPGGRYDVRNGRNARNRQVANFLDDDELGWE